MVFVIWGEFELVVGAEESSLPDFSFFGSNWVLNLPLGAAQTGARQPVHVVNCSHVAVLHLEVGAARMPAIPEVCYIGEIPALCEPKQGKQVLSADIPVGDEFSDRDVHFIFHWVWSTPGIAFGFFCGHNPFVV